MKITITRGRDGAMELSVASECDDDATLVDVLLADWRGRRQYVASSGGPVFEHRPYFSVAALPAAAVTDIEISERVERRDARIHALELEAVADSSAHEHDIAILRRDLETAHAVAKSDREKRDTRIAELEAQRDDALAKLESARRTIESYVRRGYRVG